MCFCICAYVWTVCFHKQEIKNRQELKDKDMFGKTMEIQRKSTWQ